MRIGETVRRPWRESTATVHAYLNHLADEGISFVPRVLGRDDDGREMLSYVAGDVPVEPLPPWAVTDDVLADLGALIRRLHDAAQTWRPPEGAPWGRLPGAADVGSTVPTVPTVPTGPTELVSHGDYCPGNVVFRRPASGRLHRLRPDQADHQGRRLRQRPALVGAAQGSAGSTRTAAYGVGHSDW